jgi:hypothetical protein
MYTGTAWTPTSETRKPTGAKPSAGVLAVSLIVQSFGSSLVLAP